MRYTKENTATKTSQPHGGRRQTERRSRTRRYISRNFVSLRRYSAWAMTSFCRTIACPYYWRLAVAAGGSRCIFQLQMFCGFFLPLFSEFSPPVWNVKHRKNFAFELDASAVVGILSKRLPRLTCRLLG